LLDEANLMSKLQHPNIVQVHQFLRINSEVTGDTFAMAMEYVEGGTLSAALRAAPFGRLPLAAALAIVHDTATALAYAWSAIEKSDAPPLQLIHRDLKPDNILLTRDGHSKVVDFGIAWVANDRVVRTETGITKGTLAYMSPEQIRGRPLDNRSDLYSLGTILFELITGKAYIGSDESQPVDLGAIIFRVSSIEYPDRRALLRGILTAPLGAQGHGLSEADADRWDSLLADLLTRDVDERIASAEVLLDRLDKLGTDWGIRTGRAALAEAALPPLSDAVPTNPKTNFSTDGLKLGPQPGETPLRQTVLRKRTTSRDSVPLSEDPKPYRRRNAPTLGLLAAGLVSLMTFVLLSRPVRVDQVTYDDSGSTGPILRLEGQHLEKLKGEWVRSWLQLLGKEGLSGVQFGDLEVEDGGKSAFLWVSPRPYFDATSLPFPNLTEGAETFTLPLHFHFKMRAHLFRSKKERHVGTVATFELIRSLFAHSPEMKEHLITWDSDFTVTHRPSSEYYSSSPSFVSKELRSADLVHTSTFLSILLKRMWIDREVQREPSGWGGEDSPFSWIACDVGRNQKAHYSSKVITAQGSWIDRKLPAEQNLGPADLARLLGELPEGESLEFLYGPPDSTSGYAIPCMSWRESLEHNAERVHTGHTEDHEDTLRLLLEEDDRDYRLGAVYDLMLEGRLRERDFEGAQPRVLWSRERIPHGGIVLRNAMPLVKRRAYQRGFAELLSEQDLGASIPWPDLGDVIGLNKCIVEKHERFERSLLTSSQRSSCFGGLDKAKPAPMLTPKSSAP
jgi:serine/threonine protein kinase